MQTSRTLLAAPIGSVSVHAARLVATSDSEVATVHTVAEAKSVAGPFDHGVFSFDLPDGSGIVLAAEMMLDDKIREVEFVHPETSDEEH